jgi:hypothetical protein
MLSPHSSERCEGGGGMYSPSSEERRVDHHRHIACVWSICRRRPAEPGVTELPRLTSDSLLRRTAGGGILTSVLRILSYDSEVLNPVGFIRATVRCESARARIELNDAAIAVCRLHSV